MTSLKFEPGQQPLMEEDADYQVTFFSMANYNTWQAGTLTIKALRDPQSCREPLDAPDRGSSFIYDKKDLTICQWYFLDMLYVLNESESDIVKSSHLHLSSCWWRPISLVPPSSSSSTIFVGFHWSTRLESLFTQWHMSGRWYGSRAVQWRARSATSSKLFQDSALSSRVGSKNFLNFSLSSIFFRKIVTRCVSSSGNESSSTFLPVIISISITPYAYTSTFVVTFPVAAYIPMACLSILCHKIEWIQNMTMQKHGEKTIVHIQFSAFLSKRINAETRIWRKHTEKG